MNEITTLFFMEYRSYHCYLEVIAALTNKVAAAKTLRSQAAITPTFICCARHPARDGCTHYSPSRPGPVPGRFI
jgi:hypothetical protein